MSAHAEDKAEMDRLLADAREGTPCEDGSHCCCCGAGEKCCDCGEIMPPDPAPTIGITEDSACRRFHEPGSELFDGKPCIGEMWFPPVDAAGDYVGPGVLVCDVCGAIVEPEQ